MEKTQKGKDHHAIKLSLNLEFSKSPKRAKKLVVWNFDDPLNWKSFHQRTKISDDFQKAWKTKNNVEALLQTMETLTQFYIASVLPQKEANI